MNTGIELITPEKASQLVSQNSFKNRPVNWRHVDLLAHFMRKGKFKLNGETIKLDIEGNVIDGQHRLLAIIRSNTPQAVAVARNLDPEVFDTIDKGRKRTDANILSIKDEKNTVTLSAALSIVRAYEIKGAAAFVKSHGFGEKTAEVAEPIIETLAKHSRIRESVRFTASHSKNLVFRPQALVSAAHYLFSNVSRDKTDSFFDQIINLNFPSENAPAKALVKAYHSREIVAKMKLSLRYRAGLWFKAFNAHVEDRNIALLRFREDEVFPELPTLPQTV